MAFVRAKENCASFHVPLVDFDVMGVETTEERGVLSNSIRSDASGRGIACTKRVNFAGGVGT